MRLGISVGGRNLLLTKDQAEALVNVLDGAEMFTDRHVGENLGSYGYKNSYVREIAKPALQEWLTFSAITSDQYETLKLISKLEK